MSERDYFARLEMRVCRELSGMREKVLRALWCDGFVPERFVVSEGSGQVAGRVWLARGQDQECWRFVVRLGRQARSRDEVDWDAMMPAEDVTGWLALDFDSKTMTVDPAAAYPDRPEV